MPSQYLLDRLGGSTPAPAAAHSALAELQQQAQLQRLPKKASALVTQARELSPHLFGDDGAAGFSLDLAAALARGALPNLRDGDDDARKAARLLAMLIAETVARRAPALVASDDGWQRIDAACAAVLEDASGGHSVYAPRRVVALRSLGTLIGASSSPPAAAERAHKALREMVFHAQDALQRGGAALKGSKKKEHQEWLAIAAALASMARRVVVGTDGAFCPPDWLSFLFSSMLSENPDASRAALAALAELARRRDDRRTEMAIWLTTNKRLVKSTEGLPDTLQALYYLRLCAAIAIPAAGGSFLSPAISEAFVRVLTASVFDKRLRVWLEAVQLLYGGGSAAGPFHRMMDTPAVGRVLSLALQEQASAPAVAAILRAICTVGKWLHEAPATGNLESLGQKPAAGPLLEAVLAKAAGFHQASSPSVRLAALLALAWLVPAPATAADAGGSIGEHWASLEAQTLHGAAHLTDAQLSQVLTELLARFHASASAGAPARLQLARTLLRLVAAFPSAFPSEATTEAALRVWRTLWAAADEERRGRAASAPYRLAAATGALSSSSSLLGAEAAGLQLPREVLASALAALDDAATGAATPTTALGAGGGAPPRRTARAWQAQGCSGPPSAAEAKAVRARFHRLGLRTLAQLAAGLPAGTAAMDGDGGGGGGSSSSSLQGVVLLRLQAAALYGDAASRSAALGSLCALAVGTGSLDVKMAAYEFLARGAEQAGAGALPATGGSVSREEALAWQRAAAASFDTEVEGKGLLVDGAVAATLVHLEEVLERGGGGGGMGTAAAVLSPVGLPVGGQDAQQQQAEKVPASLLVMGE